MSACMKRQRVDSVVAAETDNNAACGAACALCSSFLKEAPAECSLLAVPREVLVQILGYLDAASLLAVAQVCKAFRTFDSTTGLRLVDTIAQTQTLQASGEDLGRWRRRSWLGRLYIEDCAVGFDKFQWTSNNSPQPAAGVPPQYKFLPPTAAGSYLNIKLDGMGPKLLVSDMSTADQPVLRWRLVVRGNTAVEFGVVPLNMVEDDKSLHKCHQEEKKFEKVKGPLVDAERPTGFCSSITVGSMLPFKTAIMKGSVVELLARRGRLEILVQNPPDGQELYWHNTRTVPKPYKGPREVRFEQDFSPHHDVKLALTSWAHGAFDVLHPAPGSRLLGPDMQRAWDRQALKERSCNGAGSSESSRLRGLKCSRSGHAGPLQQQQLQQQQLQQQQQAGQQQQQQVQAGQQQPQQAVLTGMLNQQAQPVQLQHQAAVPLAVQQGVSQQQQQHAAAWPSAAGAAGEPAPSAAAAAGGIAATAAAPAHGKAAGAPGSPASEESTSSREGQLL